MPPVPRTGSPMKAAMVSGPSRSIRASSSAAQWAVNCGLGHGGVGAAEVVGRLGVEDAVERQVELVVEELQAGERAGDEAGAVVAAPAGDDLLLLGAAEDVVVIPDQLDVGLVGVGAAEAEVDLGHALGRALEDHVGQRDRGLGAVADVGVVVGELLRLRGDGVGDLRAAVADVDAVEAGEGVEEALAVAVLDVDAGAAGDDARGGLAAGVLGEVGRGVEEALAVPEGEGVVGQHGFVLTRKRGRTSRAHSMYIACTRFRIRDRVQPQSRQTYFTSMKASMPRRAPSRPRPDCLKPPKGIGAPVTLVRLTATMPNCSARVIR